MSEFKEPYVIEKDGYMSWVKLIGKVFPFKDKNKTYEPYDTYKGKENEYQMFQVGIPTTNGFINVYAKNDVAKELGQKVSVGNMIEVTGGLEEAYYEPNQSTNRRIHVFKTDKVKVVDENTEKSIIIILQGLIKGLTKKDKYTELLLEIPSQDPKYDSKEYRVRVFNNNQYLKWLNDNLTVGDVIKVTCNHWNKVIKDQNTNAVTEIKNYLELRGIDGYKKLVQKNTDKPKLGF